MKVNEIMTSQVELISSDATLVEAASKMSSLNVGSLPICEGDELLGIITDRDITIRAVAQGKGPFEYEREPDHDPEVIYCYEDDDISEAASMMEDNCIRRLLVLDSDENLCGFLSLADFSVKSQDEHLTHEVLEQVSERRVLTDNLAWLVSADILERHTPPEPDLRALLGEASGDNEK